MPLNGTTITAMLLTNPKANRTSTNLPALKILMKIINLQIETFMEDPPPTAMDNTDPQLHLVHSMHTPTHHTIAGISDTYLNMMMVIEHF